VNGANVLVCRRSIFVPLSAFLEQVAIYEAAYSADAVAPGFVGSGNEDDNDDDDDGFRGEVWTYTVPTFLCPSDSGVAKSTEFQDGGGKKPTNYAVSAGDWAESTLPNHPSWTTANLRKRNRFPNPRGFASVTQFIQEVPSITRQNTDIKDGISNTIAMGEIIIASPSEKRNVNTGGAVFAGSASQGTLADILNDNIPGNCFDTVAGKEYISGITIKNTKGKFWCQGVAQQTSFSTLLPPNGPSCFSSDPSGNNGKRFFNSAASYHNSGVNIVFADGAVKFVSNTVNTGQLQNGGKLVKTGQSQFGICGTLGSINGGDQGSL
jgi:prepilin-type processing-associated H-X9-DG protein